MKLATLFLLIAFLLIFSASNIIAGDYGLTVDATAPVPCKWDLKLSRNICTPQAVVRDLHAHFLEGTAFSIAAVEIGFMHCSVWFSSDQERQLIYHELAELLSHDKLQNETQLQTYISCFPFSSMRKAIEAELNNGHHSAHVERRLKQALSRIAQPKAAPDRQ